MVKYRKYNLNQNFFEKIDSEEKAYWLGFLYADGNIKRNLSTVSITLAKQDKVHLNKFKVALSSEHPIVDYTTNTNHLASVIEIGCVKMVKDLVKLGCFPCKSLVLKFPTEEQVPKYLLKHFIRGYFDGDGSIFQRKRNNFNISNIISFVGTKNVIVSIAENLKQILGKVYKIYSKGKIFTLTYTVKSQVYKILNWLYDNANIYLDRKYVKSKETINYLSKISNFKKCSVYDCMNKTGKSGYCKSHQYLLRSRDCIQQCQIENCNRKHKAMGYCDTHYFYYRKGGVEVVNMHKTIRKYKKLCNLVCKEK